MVVEIYFHISDEDQYTYAIDMHLPLSKIEAQRNFNISSRRRSIDTIQGIDTTQGVEIVCLPTVVIIILYVLELSQAVLAVMN